MPLNKNDFFAYYHYVQALSDERFCAPDYWKINHDTWTLYAYGNGYKVVYLKYGSKSPRSDIPTSKKTLSAKEKEERLSQSVSRTKSTIFELAFCNEFSHFCTFTQNADFVGDRFDLSAFRKDLAQFVRNQNRGRDKKITYLFVPEQHKDGAWHMHGLINGLNDDDLREFTLNERLPNKIRKQIKNGEKVYNWEKYARKFGYFTATKVKSHEACAKYITKYITKDLAKSAIKRGGHCYFASQGLKRRERILRTDDVTCPIKKWGFENDYIKTAWFDNVEQLKGAFDCPDFGTFDSELTF